MPSYDFHCNHCNTNLTLFYRSYAAYDTATPTCPHCDSTDLTRTITSVNIVTGSRDRDYSQMDANEMLSVLESGDSRAVGEMMQQVAGKAPADKLGEDYQNAAEKLKGGASMDAVEKDLRHDALGKASDAPLPKPPKSQDS